MYLWAVVGVFLYGRTDPHSDHEDLAESFSEATGEEIEDYFGSVSRAMQTLLQVLTFDDWMFVVRPIADVHYSAWPFFLSFTFFGSFGLLNLVVGVLMEEYAMRSDGTKVYQKQLMLSWQERAFEVSGEFFDLIDADNSDSISMDEITDVMKLILSGNATDQKSGTTTDEVRWDQMTLMEEKFNKLGMRLDVVLHFLEEHMHFLKEGIELSRSEFQNIIANSHDATSKRSDVWKVHESQKQQKKDEDVGALIDRKFAELEAKFERHVDQLHAVLRNETVRSPSVGANQLHCGY